jgi:nitrous oxide reductase accessory protein NosL
MAKQLLAAVALALALAGCGSGKRASPPLSPRAFVAEADRICAQATTRRGRLARLRALHPPASVADVYSHWLTAERDAITAAVALRDPSKKTELDPTVALVVADGKVTGYAKLLGAETCARRRSVTMPP